MSYHLATEKKITVVSMLCEGSSIAAISRITGIHRDTIIRLSVRMGQGCQQIMDKKMQNLSLPNIQVDELWGFIKAKQKTVNEKSLGDDAGNIWTWVALDADTKLVPCFTIGKRDFDHALSFIYNLKRRLNCRPQISSDALAHYKQAIKYAFEDNVDYGIIVKTFSHKKVQEAYRYSQPKAPTIEKKAIWGAPNMALCSTSYIEKQNHTVRMHCRRLSRLTNAFSKKRENFDAAVALHYAYYNFCKIHHTIRCTPAMEAGIVPSQWTVADLVEMIETK